jgi:hypothetical protein
VPAALLAGELQRLTTGCWNPNNTNEVVAANDTRVQGWDLRSLKYALSPIYKWARTLRRT